MCIRDRDDSDAKATEEAIEACISDGCNIIFTTSWGYMETTAEMAEKYPDVYKRQGKDGEYIGI